MTWLAWLWLAGLATLAPPTAQELQEAARQFLTDPALAPARLGGIRYGPDADTGIVTYAFGGDGGVRVAPRPVRVVGLRCPLPLEPLPAKLLGAAEAELVAREFLRRHLPEALAAGAEVTVRTAATPQADCTWRFVAERRERGFLLPTRGEVGVRVSDGKVAYYEATVQPVTLPARLAVTEEEARRIALKQFAPGSLLEPEWLESAAVVVRSPEARWRPVWGLSACLRTTAQRRWPRGTLYRWHIDAETGEPLPLSGFTGWTPEAEAWYRQHGGRHQSGPVALPYADQMPVPSPDGQRLLFLSSRPRPGYPAWRAPVTALFVVDVDGGNLRCLDREAVTVATWSPDGQQVASCGPGHLRVLDLATRKVVEPVFPLRTDLPNASPCFSLAWLADGRIAALPANRPPGMPPLVTVDPRRPEASPARLLEPPRRMGPIHALAVDGQGRLLLLCARQRETRSPEDGSSLWAMNPAQADRAPQVLVPYLTGRRMPPRLNRLAVLTEVLTRPWLLDLKAVDAQPWVAPDLGEDGPRRTDRDWYGGVCYLPDDATQIVVAPAPAKPGEPTMPVLQRVVADGPPLLITRPSADEVPLW